MVLLFHLKSQMEVLKYIRSILNTWKCPQNQEIQQNINFCVFYLIPPSRNIFVQSEWSVSYLGPNWDAFSAASENNKNAYFCWNKQKNADVSTTMQIFWWKSRNSYDSCYIYKVSCPLHNFFLQKLAQAICPTPRNTMVKPSGIGLKSSYLYLGGKFLLMIERLVWKRALECYQLILQYLHQIDFRCYLQSNHHSIAAIFYFKLEVVGFFKLMFRLLSDALVFLFSCLLLQLLFY